VGRPRRCEPLRHVPDFVRPSRGRWYLQASWAAGKPEYVPAARQLTKVGTVLGVDLNEGHLAARVVDPSGNPVGTPLRIPLVVTGLPATTRDARVRDATSALIHTAQARGCLALAIENLSFADARATGRETMSRGRRGKKFRRGRGWLADRAVPGPLGRDGLRGRTVDHRGRPGVHVRVGRPVLAQTPSTASAANPAGSSFPFRRCQAIRGLPSRPIDERKR